MTDREVLNTAFRVECMKVLGATFAEIADMMENDMEFDATEFTTKLSKILTRLGTMSHSVSDEERETIRHEVREAFIDLIDATKHYGLTAIYEAGESVNG